MSTAHPRSRGENNKGGDGAGTSPGSSPLTRGKLHLGREASAGHGLIPAHAGKTRRTRSRKSTLAAHPRSRGENLGSRRAGAGGGGSSPLTRGKPHNVTQRRFRPRLIPAHAGKTANPGTPCGGVEAHPRSRGENTTERLGTSPKPGSSPLTRGKPMPRRLAGHLTGLIPAHAGKTRPSSPSCPSTRAHPRSRGENFNQAILDLGFTGSSPLTRGKRPDRAQEVPGGGLIPAHAGKT